MNTLLSQTQAPFFDEILHYSRNPLKAFHTPGHKAGLSWEPDWLQPQLLEKLDLTEIPALDWERSLAEAEKLAAEFYQADWSFFLVQGASQGILASILGAFAPGDTILVARNCHCSVMHAIILADLIPVFIQMNFLEDWGIPAGIQPDSLKQALAAHPDCKGIVITNPTYQGVAELLHHYRELIGDRLLIVDEAHGGYFGWSGLNGFDACQVADAWVQGTHKMLGSLTQTGMLHLRGSRIDPDKVKRSLELITTTSPSYILLASLDSNRRFLATTGRTQFQEQTKIAVAFKKRMAQMGSVMVLDNDRLLDLDQTVDPWKLCLSFNQLGLDGYQAERVLRTEFGIQAEFADLNQVTFFMAPWQNPDDLTELQKAIAHLGGRSGQIGLQTIFPDDIPPLILRPRQAAFGLSRLLNLQQAVGQISAAIISPYPPGIPLIGPGELIREQEVRFIETVISHGGFVHGVSAHGEVRITNCG
jgi:arginine/lysine/ornithine decarboxylase